MNLLKIFRSPKLTVISALSFLIFSCSQYEMNETRSFNYALYKTFKEQGIKLIDLDFTDFSSRSSTLNGQDILLTLNNEYGSNLIIPDHILNAMFTKTDIEEVKTFVVSEGLLSNQDVDDLISFVDKTETDNFEVAIGEFEQDIISRNLSEAEFEKYDEIASSFKITNDENPEVFTSDNELNRGIWSCLAAYVVWIAALIGFVAGCATVFLCVAAGIGLAAATIDVVLECGTYMEEQ